MMYAVISLSGKQFMVKPGDVFETMRLESKPEIRVLAFHDGKTLTLGDPEIKGISLDFELLGDSKDDKIIVGKFRAKSRYRKRYGHRQPITKIKINGISEGKKNTAKAAEVTGSKAEKSEKVEKPIKAAESASKAKKAAPKVKKATTKGE